MVWLDKHETELGREVTVMSILKKIMGSVVLLVVLFFAGSVPVTAASQACRNMSRFIFALAIPFIILGAKKRLCSPTMGKI